MMFSEALKVIQGTEPVSRPFQQTRCLRGQRWFLPTYQIYPTVLSNWFTTFLAFGHNVQWKGENMYGTVFFANHRQFKFS